MQRICLRALRRTDKAYFAKWWRDEDLLALTSGTLEQITDTQVSDYFATMYGQLQGYHFMITLDAKPIGHISLQKRRGTAYETQVVIGEKSEWNKGHGTKAIRLLIKKALHMGIANIFLEVRLDNARAIAAYKNAGFKEAGIKKYPDHPELPETLRMVFKGRGTKLREAKGATWR